jgi:hypothetical protein
VILEEELDRTYEEVKGGGGDYPRSDDETESPGGGAGVLEYGHQLDLGALKSLNKRHTSKTEVF